MPIPVPNPEEYVNNLMKKVYYNVPPNNSYNESMKHDVEPLTSPEHEHEDIPVYRKDNNKNII